MKRKGNRVRQILYKLLPLNSYLKILSKLYFIFYNLGLLKGNKSYDYTYFLKNLVKQGDTCIDIGANMGYYTVILSKLAGSKGKIYAVEPVKPILDVLRSNTRKLKNVEILPFALGEENKPIHLGNNTIHMDGYMGTGRHSVVEQSAEVDIKFDAEMKKGSEVFEHLEKLDFVKCDIEGYELIALMELEPVITKHRPVLLIETNKENRRTLIQFFKENHFNTYILKNGSLVSTSHNDNDDMLTIPIEKETELIDFINKTQKN